MTDSVRCRQESRRYIEAIQGDDNRLQYLRSEQASMTRLTIAIFLLLLITVIGGGAFLAMWEIPAPSATVEKTLPDDRFPR